MSGSTWETKNDFRYMFYDGKNRWKEVQVIYQKIIMPFSWNPLTFKNYNTIIQSWKLVQG